jgi:uncharacterized protein (TIGR02271 family)
MQHTLVAVFDNRSDAQNALDELLASGFERSRVNLSGADATGQSDSLTGSSTTTDTAHEEGIGASIKHFFTGLFGEDSDAHVQKYSNVVSSGHYAVTVVTDTEPEVERAADVVERFGPVDIDERHDQLTGGNIAGGSFSGAAASGVLGSASSGYASQSGSLQSGQAGSLQSSAGDDNGFFSTQSLNDPVPRDSTYQEAQGQSLQTGLSPNVGSASLQGTASLQDSDDASLGGTALQSSGSLQSDSSLQRDSSLSGSQQYSSAGSLSGTTASNVGDRTAIPVVQEDLKVGKREVQRGGVRVFSRIVETPVNESVNLREEHVSVERRPVDQPLSAADAAAFKEQSIELRETAEEAVVQKTARVVEEVVVGKEVSERQQQINDTVRHTDVQVESLGASADTDDSYYRNHYNSNLASSGSSYDDLAPAYRYGTEARSKYSGREWNDVESDLRSDWDSRYGNGGSTWEKFKAAARHGWDKVTK